MPLKNVKAKQWPDHELYRIQSQDSSHLCRSGQGTPGASKIRQCSVSYPEWIAYGYLLYHSLNHT